MKRSRSSSSSRGRHLHSNCCDRLYCCGSICVFNISVSTDLLLLFCVFLFSCVVALQEGLVMAQEMDVLLKLKESFHNKTGLSSWTITNSSSSNPNSHDPASHCKGWAGVTCDNTTFNVVELSLSGLLLGGGGGANQSNMFVMFLKDLPYLERLDLSRNKLSGYIPTDLYLFRSLKSLDLSRNRLKGEIPSNGWDNLANLQILYLHKNQLTGHIPPQLSGASRLERIVLKNNNLEGPIPGELFGANLKSLTHFEIDSNNLTGAIPEGIGASVSLQSFRASFNQLNGTLPDSIGNVSGLREFVVNNNRLSGWVPASLLGLSNLTVLNLSYNDFVGPVPTNISRFNVSSFLGNPSLCGPPPLENACPSVSPPRAPEVDHEPPKPPDRDNRGKSKQKNQQIVPIIIIVASVVGVALLVLMFALVYRRRRRHPMNYELNNWFGSGINNVKPQGQFTAYRQSFNKYAYEELVANAGHFDTAHVLGKGRFATVYKAILPDGMTMAIKVFKHANMQPNFEKHLDSLALLKHKNLLCIRGFFSSPLEKAILYDYLPIGTLHELLHRVGDQGKHLLDWPTRHKIALGVAQAMVYLHGNKVLHRDLKSTNILLQEAFVPKVSDFGLIHIVSESGGNEVSTHDYVAPEVCVLANSNPIKKNFTEKSDVYSYGMVLLELITSQKATSNLREIAMHMDKEGRGRDVVDPFVLQSSLWPEYIDKALSLAILCVSESPSSRPTMVDIVSILDGLCPILSPLKSPHSDSP